MWEPKIDSTTSGNSSPSTQQQKESSSLDQYDKLNVEDSSQIDSGFLSSENILNSGFSSYGEDDPATTSSNRVDQLPPPIAADQHHKEETAAPKDTVLVTDSAYLDSGLIDDIELSKSGIEAEGDNKMLLERELDNGLGEWLCTLDLKNTGRSQINNLNRKVDSATASLDQLNISDAPSANKRSKTTRQTVEVPEKEEPWEVCYIQDGEGDTYLHLAVSDGNEEFVRNLIKITPHPCLLDIQNDFLQSPLHLAVLVGNVKIVRMLLLAGAETSMRDKYGNTPLHLACASGDLDCVRALTERITASEEATSVSCTGVLLAKAAAEGAMTNTKQTRPHFIQYADVELRNYDGERCVHIVSAITGTEKNKHIDMMRELVVRCGADVNAREGKAGYTALHMAVERGDEDLVKFMLEECTSLNLEVASYGRWTAYQIATVNRNQELMSLLRSKGAEELDVSSSDESDDSDGDENEIMEMYGHSAAGYFNNDRRVPTAINVA